MIELPQQLKDTVRLDIRRHYDIPFGVREVNVNWSAIGAVDPDTAEAHAREILARAEEARRVMAESQRPADS